MVRKIHLFQLIIVLLLISLFSSCNFFLSLVGDMTESDTIAVQPANSQTTLGSAVQFKAILKSRNSADTDITTKSVWSSSDTNIATVSDKGVVYAIGLGTALITALRDGTQGSGEIVVNAMPPTPTPTPVPTPTPTPRPTSNPAMWNIRANNFNKQAPALCGYLANNHLYVGTGGAGSSLKIYDASDPLDLKLTSTLSLAYPAEDIVVDGYNVFIANSNSGLTIVDASDPYNPQPVKTLPMAKASGVFVSGNYAYVATDGGLAVVQDILTPSTASIAVSSCSLGGYPANKIIVSGNYAYLTTSGGVAIVDVTNPNTPQYKNTSGTSGTNQEIVINGNYVYYTNSDSFGNLRVLNVSNPLSPVPTGTPVSNCGYGIALNGTEGYATSDNILYRLAVVAPGDTVYTNGGSVPTRPGSLEIVLNGNYAYVINSYFGISTIDITTTPPTFVKFTPTSDSAVNVAISGNYAYIADNRGGLQIVDNIESPYAARLVNTVKLGDYVVDVAVSGSYAYAAVKAESTSPDVPELQIVDISDPYNVSVVGTLNIPPMTAVSIDVLGALVFLGTDNSMVVIDVSVPTVPVQVGTVSGLGSQVHDVKAAGKNVYLANGANGLKVYDVTDPSNPTPVPVVSTGYAYKLALDTSYCYLSNGSGLDIIALSDLSVIAHTYSAIGTVGVDVSGNYAYLAKGITYGIEIVDITDIYNPSSVKTINPSPSIDANAIVVTPWYGYVAAGASGFLILGE